MAEYSFEIDWFSHNAPTWAALLSRLGKVQRILEIGSYEGRSATWFMENAFRDDAKGEIVCIDKWDFSDDPGAADPIAGVEARFDKNMEIATERTGGNIKVRKIKAPSAEGLVTLLSEKQERSFDVVYVDGGHTSALALTDLVFSFPLAKVGALIIVDDYVWNQAETVTNNILEQPKLAVDGFVNCFHNYLQVVAGAPLYQMYLQKKGDP